MQHLRSAEHPELVTKPPAADASGSRPRVTEGVYTLEGRPAAKLDSARTVLRRVPGARAAYESYSLASTELRLSLRGSLSARRARRDIDARDRFKRQAVRTIASPLIDAAPDAQALKRLLEVRGFDVRIAERHIYLPPQPGLRSLLQWFAPAASEQDLPARSPFPAWDDRRAFS